MLRNASNWDGSQARTIYEPSRVFCRLFLGSPIISGFSQRPAFKQLPGVCPFTALSKETYKPLKLRQLLLVCPNGHDFLKAIECVQVYPQLIETWCVNKTDSYDFQRVDVESITRQHIRNGRLEFRADKIRAMKYIPIYVLEIYNHSACSSDAFVQETASLY